MNTTGYSTGFAIFAFIIFIIFIFILIVLIFDIIKWDDVWDAVGCTSTSDTHSITSPGTGTTTTTFSCSEINTSWLLSVIAAVILGILLLILIIYAIYSFATRPAAVVVAPAPVLPVATEKTTVVTKESPIIPVAQPPVKIEREVYVQPQPELRVASAAPVIQPVYQPREVVLPQPQMMYGQPQRQVIYGQEPQIVYGNQPVLRPSYVPQQEVVYGNQPVTYVSSARVPGVLNY